MTEVEIINIFLSFMLGPTKASEVESKYLIPIFDRLFCCFPNKWRAKCRCGTEDVSSKVSYLHIHDMTN